MDGFYKARALWQGIANLLIRFKFLILTLLCPFVLYGAYLFLRPPDKNTNGTAPLANASVVADADGSSLSRWNPFRARETTEEEKERRRRKALERHRLKSVTSEFAYGSKSFLASNHTRFDQAAGQTKSVHGILHPRDASKRTDALLIHNKFFEEGLRNKQATHAVAGHMWPAGKAKDITSTDARPPRPENRPSDLRSSARVDAPETESGLHIRLEAEEEGENREMRQVSVQGSIEAERMETPEKAVNANSNQTREVLEGLKTPEAPKPEQINLPRSSTRGRIQSLERREAVQATVEKLEDGSTKETDLSKVTVAQVYTKLGKEKQDNPEIAAELGGAVFDGKQPGGETLSGRGASGAAEGSNKLLLSEASEMEGNVDACQKAEREVGAESRGTLKWLADKGLDIRAKVAACRDLIFSCMPEVVKYEDCKKSKKKPKPNCTPHLKAQKSISKSWKICQEELAKMVEGFRSRCDSYNKNIEEKMGRCKLEHEGVVKYDCESLGDDARTQANQCIVPANWSGNSRIGTAGGPCLLRCKGS